MEGEDAIARETGLASRGRMYACIDLKSFYASVECCERGLDPLTTKLVVADPDRTEKTICLAVSPAMKKLGVRNRCRVFEIPSSIDYIKAKPHMRRYMEVSANVYAIYLRYVSAEDVHVYSIDECFIDVTPYTRLYAMSAREFVSMLMREVLEKTGVPATAGIGTNLFLAKVALDVKAKHAPDGIAYLDEQGFAAEIQDHRPITDIWQIGPGIARRLEKYQVFDLKGVASLSERVLFREFGVNARFLIDHAHGIEPCTIAQIKDYVPAERSLTAGQVLACDYSFSEAKVVLREMVESLSLDLVAKKAVAGSLSVQIGYARDGLPPFSSASKKLARNTSSFRELFAASVALFDEGVDRGRAIRRLNVSVGGLLPERCETFTLFDDVAALKKERDVQGAVIAVKGRFGKNAVVRGTSFKEKATGRQRNSQIGGHNA